MKVVNLKQKKVQKIPLIDESEFFSLNLDENYISNLDEIPINCTMLSLKNNK